MKKRVLLGALAGVALLLSTGCGGSKTLVCTMTEEETGATMTMQMNVSFKDDVATKFDATIDMNVEDEYASYTDLLVSSLEEQFSSFEDSGIDVDVKSSGNKVTASLGANFEQLTEDQKEELGFDPAENTYDAVKSQLEDTGMTCK